MENAVNTPVNNDKSVEDLLAMLGIETIEIKREISKYKFLLYGVMKSGKTDLLYEIAKREYGSPNACLYLAFENGQNAAIGARVKRMKTWADLLKLISGFEKIAEMGMDNPVKMLAWDTMDIAVNMAEKFVVARGKANSLNTLGGGFGRGHQILADEILDALNRLENLGIGIWLISHDKSRDTTDINGNTFKEIDNTITGKPRQVVNGFVDFIVYIDNVRTFEEIEMPNGDTVNRKKEEKRIIRFRGDTRIRSGARFPDIVKYVDYGADNFIGAVKDAIEARAKDADALDRIKKQNEELAHEKIEVLGETGGNEHAFTDEMDDDTPVPQLLKDYFTEAPHKKKYVKEALEERGVNVKKMTEYDRRSVVEVIGLSRRDDATAAEL